MTTIENFFFDNYKKKNVANSKKFYRIASDEKLLAYQSLSITCCDLADSQTQYENKGYEMLTSHL